MADASIWLPGSDTLLEQLIVNAMTATSNSSVVLGAGTKTFLLNETTRLMITGNFVLCVDAGNTANYMEGQILSYDPNTGTLIVTVSPTSFIGSGTIASWTVTVAGIQGLDSSDIAIVINAATAKTIPIDADLFGIVDSAASNVLKKLSWSNLKATFGAGNNTFSGNNTHSGTETFSGGVIMSGKSIFDANASIAAHATTMNPWSLGNYVTLTGGAVTFTAMAAAPQAGAEVELYMNAAHVFTDGAVFEVDGNATWTAAIGDRVLLRAKSTTVFTAHPRKADGTSAVRMQSKVISATRDISLASGTQDVTGFGFDPSAAFIVYGFNTNLFGSWGIVASDATQGGNFQEGGTGYIATANAAIYHGDNAGNNYAGTISYITDGIRITWVKTGSPTGTGTFKILGMR